MTAEARQHYYSDINGKLSMHVPNLEGVTQAEDRNPTINLEDWTITVAEPPKLIRLKCANHHPKGNPG